MMFIIKNFFILKLNKLFIVKVIEFTKRKIK